MLSKSTLLSIAVVAGLLPAQSPVHAGIPGGAARCMEPWRRSLAAMPDGSLWCLVYDADGSGTPAGAHLLLLRSQDSGASWAAMADTPTIGDNLGAISSGPGSDVLHVAWGATDGGAQVNLYYQAFDTRTLGWIGARDLLLQGANANDQYYATDIAVTERGTIGVALQTHRTPLAPGLTPWSGGLLVKRTADTAFHGPYCFNTDSYGVNLDIQAVGEVFHGAFRTNTGLYGIRYRAFDSAALQFQTNTDVPIYGANQATMLASNASNIAADADGNLYILFATGATTAGQGDIRLCYAAAGNYGTWTSQSVAQDPDLTAGNVTYLHYGLARGEGGTVYAIYSKRTQEQHQNLYMRIYAAGTALTPEVPLVLGTEVDAFTVVCGVRSENLHSSLMALVSGTPPSQPQGRVQFVSGGTLARTLRFGSSCQGSLPDLPRLSSQTLPAGGTTYVVGADRLPANSFGLMLVGGALNRPPIALDALGLPGCQVFANVWGTLGFVANAGGAATLQLSIPNGPGYANLPLYFAALVLAPGANAAGAVSTNALLTLVR